MNKVAKKISAREAKFVSAPAIRTVSYPNNRLQHATNNCELYKKSANLVVAKNYNKSSNTDCEADAAADHTLFDFYVSRFFFITG